jgi:predicted esterase
MLTSAPEGHSFEVPAEFRYLLYTPANVPRNSPVLFTLHGYAQNADAMLRLTAAAVDNTCPIVSVEGPNQSYLQAPGGDVGYNWGVSDHAAANVALHHRMLRWVLTAAQTRFGVGPQRCVLVAFSQTTSFNYRFAGTFPEECGGLIGICGGVPGDWETGPFAASISSPVLHISRSEDEYYPVAKAEEFPTRLRRRFTNVEFHMLPGAHRFPSKGGPVIRDWLARHFGAATTAA